ncbi:hypothetical protein DFR52_10582 [Hoeflea marina]|uniref:DUF2125 domain-containing protein n=1 Tax=Hoeflea marina TaxID=274592 RepID=A0A317PGE6_9HYPH|nr:DUF2125 domain-containing protein [Hoeflea marina]PWV98104.1 hypothetical protein DFR52_10582 [Hoeflea marina]
MTNSNQTPHAPKSGARKFVWLGGAIIVACLLWTAGWFYAAGQMQTHLPALLQLAARNGVVTDCGNADVRGYPFRIGLFCDQTRIEIPSRQITVTSSAFRSAAQIYRPGHVISEIDGPLTVTDAGGVSAKLDWQALQTSSVVGLNGLDRASLNGRLLSMGLDSPDLPSRLALTADSFEFHVRQRDEDADIAGSASQVSARFGPEVDVRSLSYDLTLVGGAAWLAGQGNEPDSLRGSTVQIRDATLNLSDSSALTVNGQVDVGADGLLSGSLKVTIKGMAEISRVVAVFASDLADQADALAPVLNALDSETGDNAITLPLTLSRGQASMGFIPLGRIPAL